jgi:DNA-binding helix-hairpin-helix protein with protein kinase domain
MEPPPHVPLLRDIPIALGNAFERSFGPIGPSAGRPRAAEWVQLLEEAEKELVRCTSNPAHHHFRAATACPWCVMERASPGFVAFVAPAFSTRGTPINLAQLIAALQAIPNPGVAPALPAMMPPFSGAARGMALEAATLSERRYAAGVVGAVIGSATVVLVPSLLWVGAAIALGSGILGVRTSNALAAFKQAHAGVVAEWANIEARWRQVAGNETYLVSRGEAEDLVRQVQRLPSEETSRLQSLKVQQRERQLRLFLEHYPVRHAKIKGIGDSRKVTLRSYGVDSAADVERSRIEGIPGFGPAMANALLRWRAMHEQRFRFDPSQPIDPSDLAAVKSDISRKRNDLEARLRQSIARLQSVSTNILSSRAAMRTTATGVWNALKQAEADINVLQTGSAPQKKLVGILIAIVISLIAAGALKQTFNAMTAKVDEPKSTAHQASSSSRPITTENSLGPSAVVVPIDVVVRILVAVDVPVGAGREPHG